MASAGSVTIKVILDAKSAQSEAEKLKTSLNGIEGVAAASATGLGKTKASADETSRSFVGLTKGTDQGKKGLEGLKSAGSGIVGNALGLAAVTGTTFGIMDLASEAISASDSLTKFESTMGFAGYDGATIQKAKDDVKSYADQTVYDMQTIANTTAQLAANGVQDYTGLTQAAGNLNAVAGGNAETFKSVAYMLTQTAGAGKLTTENWNQLADAIPGASGRLQEAMRQNGAYTGNFREAMEKGEITADEFNQALMQLGNEPVAVEAAKSTETFEGAVGQLQATAVNAFLQIYNAIGQDNITGAINTLTSAVQWLIDNFNLVAPLVGGLVGTFAAFKAAMAIQGVVNTAVTAIKGLSAGVGLAKGAFQALNVVMRANPFGVVVTVIGLLVTAFMTLWSTNEGFRNAVTAIWNAIVSTIGGVISAIVNFFTVTVPTAINSMVSFFAALPGNILTFLTMVLTNIGNFVLSLATQAIQAGSQFLTNIVNFFMQLPGQIASFLGSVVSNVINFVSQMASNAIQAGSQFLSNIINFITQLPGQIAGFLSSAISNVINFASNMGAQALQAGQNFLNNIINTLQSIPGRVVEIGANIVSGLINGITSNIGRIGETLLGGVQNAINTVKGFLGIHSPSTLMRDEIGKMMGEGLSVGFTADDPMGGILSNVKSGAKQLPKALSNLDWYSTSGAFGVVPRGSSGYQEVTSKQPVSGGSERVSAASGSNKAQGDTYIFNGDIHIECEDVEQVRDMGELARAIMKQGAYVG